MALLDSQALQPEFIKMRWLEPYVSAGLNRKTFKSLPRGVYSGFVVKPGPAAFEVQVVHDDPEGYGEASGFSAGAFDPASSGWSVAVHASLQGYTSTVAILTAPGGANDFVFDLTARKGSSVYLALFVNYQVGFTTAGEVRVVEAVDLDADPTLINLARVDVPLVGSISTANIVYNDALYPRVFPFATKFKYGFMDKFQAALLEEVASISGSPAFVQKYVVPVDGPQTIPLSPGARYTVAGDDLWVFKNTGLRCSVRDYDEVDRGDGYGEEIYYTGTLKSGDILTLRVQQFSSVLTSTTQVLDENALISANVQFINFAGTGVFVTPDGPNRVKVNVPGGGSGSALKTKFNDTGSAIVAFRAVKVNTDNTIALFDPTVSGDHFYGITIANIPDQAAGDVQTGGNVENALTTVLGTIGDDVYISHAGDGTFTTTPPNPFAGQIVRAGILDGPGAGAVTGSGSDLLFDRGRLN